MVKYGELFKRQLNRLIGLFGLTHNLKVGVIEYKITYNI
jgi:hypothetical protein